MADKQIKIWLSIFIFTLMAVGSAASYFAQGRVFYKGTRKQETVNSGEFYTSVLNTGTESAEQAPELNFKAPENFVIPAEAGISDQNDIPPKTQPVSSPCSDNERPIIKNGQISGCTSQKKPEPVQSPAVKITAPSKPGPKVKIPPSPPPSISQFPNFPISQYPSISCESQGKFTYTGPDRPGILYGMCIECESSQYIINGGKC